MKNDTNKPEETIYGDGTIIMIEKVNPTPESNKEVVMTDAAKPRHTMAWAIALAILALLVVIVFLLIAGQGKSKVADELPAELPTSTTAEQNTEILQEKALPTKEKAAITLTNDTINDVSFSLFTISGLKAEITFDEPDPNDPNLYLSINSADVRSDNGGVLGACIIAGQQVSRGNSRTGYFAAVGDNMVIGVASNDSVMEYARQQKGYFFRQFPIVSDGQLGDVRLKGKAPRSAIGTKDGRFIYVKSHNRESLYDFAEALCDYGFTDALYIPADNRVTTYRDSTGRWQNDKEGEPFHSPYGEDSSIRIPRLVFKPKRHE